HCRQSPSSLLLLRLWAAVKRMNQNRLLRHRRLQQRQRNQRRRQRVIRRRLTLRRMQHGVMIRLPRKKTRRKPSKAENLIAVFQQPKKGEGFQPSPFFATSAVRERFVATDAQMTLT